MTEPVLQDINFRHAEAVFTGELDMAKIDIGSITLSCEGRSFVMDITATAFIPKQDGTRLEFQLYRDEETFPDCKYNLKPEDLLSKTLKAEIFLGGDFDNEIEYMALYVYTNNTDMSIVLELEE